MPKEKRIIVLDLTGPNARCRVCKKTVGDKAVVYQNNWYCVECRDKAKKFAELPTDENEMKRKLKKRGRTAKNYLREKFEMNPGVEFSVADLGEALIQEGLTRQDTIAGAKQTASVTISILRKENFPIDKVKRGVYKWRERR